MSSISIAWTEGAEEALKKDQALIDKVGNGDLEAAKRWHENKVRDFVDTTPAVQIATRGRIRCVIYRQDNEREYCMLIAEVIA